MAIPLSAWLESADALAAAGDPARALDRLERLLAGSPDNPAILERLAELTARLGQTKSAVSWFLLAARQAEARGILQRAGLHYVRAARLIPRAAIGAALFARRLGRTNPPAAIELLSKVADDARRGGSRTGRAWFRSALPLALKARDLELSRAVVHLASHWVGPERVCYLLVAPCWSISSWDQGLRFAALQLCGVGSNHLQVAQLEQLVDRELEWLRGEPNLPAGDPPAPPPPGANWRREVEVGLGSPPARPWRPCNRNHRPRPWQIPPALEALPASRAAPFPREFFGRLPEPMRRYVLWMERQQRSGRR